MRYIDRSVEVPGIADAASSSERWQLCMSGNSLLTPYLFQTCITKRSTNLQTRGVGTNKSGDHDALAVRMTVLYSKLGIQLRNPRMNNGSILEL